MCLKKRIEEKTVRVVPQNSVYKMSYLIYMHYKSLLTKLTNQKGNVA